MSLDVQSATMRVPVVYAVFNSASSHCASSHCAISLQEAASKSGVKRRLIEIVKKPLLERLME